MRLSCPGMCLIPPCGIRSCVATGKAPGNAGCDEEIRGSIVQAGAGADVELEIVIHQEGKAAIDTVLIGRAFLDDPVVLDKGAQAFADREAQCKLGAKDEVAARVVLALGLAREVEVASQVPTLGEVPGVENFDLRIIAIARRKATSSWETQSKVDGRRRTPVLLLPQTDARIKLKVAHSGVVPVVIAPLPHETLREELELEPLVHAQAQLEFGHGQRVSIGITFGLAHEGKTALYVRDAGREHGRWVGLPGAIRLKWLTRGGQHRPQAEREYEGAGQGAYFNG